jgi:hypothetical protein
VVLEIMEGSIISRLKTITIVIIIVTTVVVATKVIKIIPTEMEVSETTKYTFDEKKINPNI